MSEYEIKLNTSRGIHLIYKNGVAMRTEDILLELQANEVEETEVNNDSFELIESVEELKKSRPNLVEEFEAMDKEQLLKQIYLEVLDANNMESRVSLFMNECTNNMSNTTYTLGSLKTLINEQKDIDAEETLADYLMWK